MKKVKVAVAGLHRGGNLADFIVKYTTNIELVAVCDLDRSLADRYAKEHNIPAVYYSLDDVLKTDIDAVVLATPIPNHEEHVVKSLNAGKHVLSEVISATTIEGCQRIADAVKASGKKYMMEENYCYYRPLTIVKNMIDNGLLGDMYYGESDYLMDFEQRPGFPDIQPWRKQVYFGRRGHPYITHTLGPLCYALGSDIKTVTCMAAGRHDGVTADKTCVLMLQTQDNGMIRLRNSFMCARPDLYTYYSVQGTKGCYQGSIGSMDCHKIHIRGLCGSQEWRDVYDFKGFLPKEWQLYPKDYFDDTSDDGCTLYDSGTPLLLQSFAKAILEDTEPPVSAKRSLNWTAAGILSEQSVKNGGEPVEIPDFGL